MDVFIDRMNELKGSMNVSAFARKAGIPQPSMDKYLKGRLPSIEILQSLCCRFGVSSDWLLGLSDERGGGTPAAVDADAAQKIASLEKEIGALKGEIKGLQFALDAAMKGGGRAPASASRSRPASSVA